MPHNTARHFDPSTPIPRGSQAALPLSFGLSPQLVLAQNAQAVALHNARKQEARAAIKFGPDQRTVALENRRRAQANAQSLLTNPQDVRRNKIANDRNAQNLELETATLEADKQFPALQLKNIKSLIDARNAPPAINFSAVTRSFIDRTTGKKFDIPGHTSKETGFQAGVGFSTEGLDPDTSVDAAPKEQARIRSEIAITSAAERDVQTFLKPVQLAVDRRHTTGKFTIDPIDGTQIPIFEDVNLRDEDLRFAQMNALAENLGRGSKTQTELTQAREAAEIRMFSEVSGYTNEKTRSFLSAHKKIFDSGTLTDSKLKDIEYLLDANASDEAVDAYAVFASRTPNPFDDPGKRRDFFERIDIKYFDAKAVQEAKDFVEESRR